MKRFLSAALCAAVLSVGAYSVCADTEYVNDFENDCFVWTNGNSGNANYIKAQNSSDGYSGSGAKKIVFDHSLDTWSATVTMKMPSEWSMEEFSGGAYVHFMAKGENNTAQFNSMCLEFKDADNKDIVKKYFTVSGSGYEHIIIPVAEDLSALSSIRIADNMKKTAGEITIDDFSISSAAPERRVNAEINQIADFELQQTSLSTASTYAGFKNNAGDYKDYITAKTAEGKSGSGLEISYRAATWYSGEVFLNAPSVWDTNKDIDALEFDYKGKGRIKVKLMCGKVIAGDRYETTVIFEDDGEWHHVFLPLEEFKKSGVSVKKEDILGIAFTSAENGNLNNNKSETKAMSAEELSAKAREGAVVIDNLSLTNKKLSAEVKLYQADKELKSLGEASDGAVTAEAEISGLPYGQSTTAVFAVYDADGRLVGASSGSTVGCGTIRCTSEISDTKSKKAKVIILGGFEAINPLGEYIGF